MRSSGSWIGSCRLLPGEPRGVPPTLCRAPAAAALGAIGGPRLRQHQLVHAEVAVRVHPQPRRLPTGAARNCAKLLHRILVGVFGVDALALSEREGAAEHLHRLADTADQVHLDAFELLI